MNKNKSTEMKRSLKAENILPQINSKTKLGDLRKIAKDIKKDHELANEEPEVQWAMNFTAGWIGVYYKKNRARCIKLGEKTGLYKDEMVSKGCTPNYLPEFITIEVNKRNNN